MNLNSLHRNDSAKAIKKLLTEISELVEIPSVFDAFPWDSGEPFDEAGAIQEAIRVYAVYQVNPSTGMKSISSIRAVNKRLAEVFSNTRGIEISAETNSAKVPASTAKLFKNFLGIRNEMRTEALYLAAIESVFMFLLRLDKNFINNDEADEFSRIAVIKVFKSLKLLNSR